MASSHFGSSTKRSSRVCKSFQLVKPNQYSSTSMFGGRGHQSHKGRRGAIRWLFVASQRTLCRGQVENLEPQRSRRTREVRRERERESVRDCSQSNTTVLFPYNSTRFSMCQRTARE